MIPIAVRSRSKGMEEAIRRLAERRVNFSLDRLREFHRINISIEDVNGPKGGVDKHCRIVAKFGIADIVIEETRSSWQSAIVRAIHRLAQTATKKMQCATGSVLHRGCRTPHRVVSKDTRHWRDALGHSTEMRPAQ